MMVIRKNFVIPLNPIIIMKNLTRPKIQTMQQWIQITTFEWTRTFEWNDFLMD